MQISDKFNPRIISPETITRSIVAENGASTINDDFATIESFTYTDKAVRFLTTQEVSTACEITVENAKINEEVREELDGCTWLMENIGRYEERNRSYGYWLETPNSSNYTYVWFVRGYGRNVQVKLSRNPSKNGVRPVITVKTSDLG